MPIVPETKAQEISRKVQGTFYVIAGAFHFINPRYYLGIMPDFLPDHMILINMAGGAEIMIGLMFWYGAKYWRSLGAFFLMFLLIILIILHINKVVQTHCDGESVCWSSVYAWIRLLIIHPLFLFWAWLEARNFFGNKRESPFALFSDDRYLK